MSEIKKLTGFGQIKKGDTVSLVHNGITEFHFVDEVLNQGDQYEEILLDKRANIYFIVSMAIDGTSLAKDVQFISRKVYKLGECMNEKEIRVDAIKGFVNLMIGAHEAGFVDKNNPTLSEIHQVAKNHIKDSLGIDTPCIVEEFGLATAIACGMDSKIAMSIADMLDE